MPNKITTPKNSNPSPKSNPKTKAAAKKTSNGSNGYSKFQHRVRSSFGRIDAPPMPHLLDIQLRSFQQFLQLETHPDQRKPMGLEGIFHSMFPISDFTNSSTLSYVHYTLSEPHYTEDECRIRGVTYSRPLRIALRLILWEKEVPGKERGIRDVKEQDIYLGELPMMTDQGAFIINGTERVIVSQMHKSPGAFFVHDNTKSSSGKKFYSARIIPQRGSWVDFEFDSKEILHVRIDRKRKFPATLLLRSMGHTEQDLLNRFYFTQEIDLSQALKKEPENRIFYKKFDAKSLLKQKILLDIKDPKSKEILAQKGRRITQVMLRKLEQAGLKQIPTTAEEIVGAYPSENILDENGEILAALNTEITPEVLEKILQAEIKTISLLSTGDHTVGESLRKTLAMDGLKSPQEAMIELYKRLKPGDPPTLESARNLLNSLFFNPERYSLSRVGRLKLNKKLGMQEDLDHTVLVPEDIFKTVEYLLHLKEGEGTVDDIDHLGNRRVRSVGELLENQFRVGLVRMERSIKERMSMQEADSMMLHDIVNVKPVSAAINEFFGSSQLSQFMDQTNPLAEITHKRRLSALGPGGLTREWAGFDVRDVHTSHYGRICPVETPEGPNIGLIASLAIYASINEFGFIETPYHRVEGARVLPDVSLLSAVEEDQFKIAQANAPLDKQKKFASPLLSSRHKGEFEMISAEEIDYMDVAPHQLVSAAAALIPFLEHDDANRALMGSNMQRQAVPLISPKAPLVGTGLESKVAADSGACLVARRAGVINRIDAARIIIQADRTSHSSAADNKPNVDIYHLSKFRSSNQNICINQRPIVKVGQHVKAGDIIADGSSCDKGELALGQNMLVAFMPWNGYNFEDSILVSERVVHDDLFTSIHIEELEVVSRETKLGKEDLTRDIPNVGEDALRNLDESGIIRIGTYVKQGDILVGKVTPKGETQPNPEEKLLRAIFGEKAGDFRDTCLRVSQGIDGVVINVVIFNRKGLEKDERSRQIEKETLEQFTKDYRDETRIVRKNLLQLAVTLLKGHKLAFDLAPQGHYKLLLKKGQNLTPEVMEKIPLRAWEEVHVSDESIEGQLRQIVTAALAQVDLLEKVYQNRCEKIREGDELPPGVIRMVKVSLAVKRKLSVGDKMAGRHGNKGVVSRIETMENMPYMADGTPVDVVLNPLGVPSRMNVGQVLETHLGWASHELGKQLNDMVRQAHPISQLRDRLNQIYQNKGVQDFFQSLDDHKLLEFIEDFKDGIHFATPVFDGANENNISHLLKLAGLPESGQVELYDGFTGEAFDQAVTVGKIYMMKLHHLVDDKIHARSIGPYSLVTQQPLGGKAQFGGQRFGEMEVWALEAYGAAYTLQELLTVKSDDVVGRNRIYETIVKGNYALETGVPESFKVLTNELKSLCLSIKLQ